MAYADPDHEHHEAVHEITHSRPLGLSSHAAFETLSVLTRLPSPKRLSGADAARLITTNFPQSRFLSPESALAFLGECADKGILGGAIYDGLVGAAAREHALQLLSCDRRAQDIYDALKVSHLLVR